MKKFGAELIILGILFPILLAVSGYVASKTVDNENEISALKTADKYQVEMLKEMKLDIKTLLKR